MSIHYNNKTSEYAVIFFHKNIQNLYNNRWIVQCVESVLNQKNIKFDILEINYGNTDYSVLENYKNSFDGGYFFYKADLPTHTDAMVYILNKGFCELGYNIIFNTNLDDYYNDYRFTKQVECLNSGYLLCSSFWSYIKSSGDSDNFYQKITNKSLGVKINGNYIFFNSIKNELERNHNVINHSGVAFSKNFWYSLDKYNNLLRYRDDKPFEDMTLWKRAVENNILITIINEDLITYRLHGNQIGSNKDNNKSGMDGGYKKEPNMETKRVGIYLYIDGNMINEISGYISSIESYFLPNFRKIFFITTNDIELISREFSKTQHEFYIKNIFTDYDNLENVTTFYPQIETLCDIIYHVPFDIGLILEKQFGNNILNDKERPLIKVVNFIGATDENFIFGGLTNPFINAVIKSNGKILEYIENNQNLIKTITDDSVSESLFGVVTNNVNETVFTSSFNDINRVFEGIMGVNSSKKDLSESVKRRLEIAKEKKEKIEEIKAKQLLIIEEKKKISELQQKERQQKLLEQEKIRQELRKKDKIEKQKKIEDTQNKYTQIVDEMNKQKELLQKREEEKIRLRLEERERRRNKYK